MLPSNLTTNEVKGSGGNEIEFVRRSQSEKQVVFQAATESPKEPQRLSISHEEIGTGNNRRRRSRIRVDKTIQVSGEGEMYESRVVSAYVVLDAPVGRLDDVAQLKETMAYLISFLASTGANTTILYDCTGYGAASLVNGTL